MLYNVTSFVDGIIGKLMKERNIKFALKCEMMCLLGRLIGRNKIIYPPYYNLVHKFIRPELKNPARLFAFIAESVHEHTPLEDLGLICKELLKNFVSDGLPEEKIVMGINTLRLVMFRNELALTNDEINYVCSFRKYRNKNVSTSAKAFINVMRDLCPQNL